jgi:hypothetical protein
MRAHSKSDRKPFFCHSEASAAQPKNLVAPPKEVAPPTCTMSDAACHPVARTRMLKQQLIGTLFRDSSASLRSPQNDNGKIPRGGQRRNHR